MRTEINHSLGIPLLRSDFSSSKRQRNESHSERNTVTEHKVKKGPTSKEELPFVSSNIAQNISDPFICIVDKEEAWSVMRCESLLRELPLIFGPATNEEFVQGNSNRQKPHL